MKSNQKYSNKKIGKAIKKIMNECNPNFISLSSVVVSEEDGKMYEDLSFSSVEEIIEWYNSGKKKSKKG